MGQCIITYIVLDNVCTIQVQPERGGKLLWNNAKYAVGINKKCLQLWMCSGVSDKETKLQPSCQRWLTSTGTPVTESSTDFHCMQWSEEPFLWKTITASKNYLNGGLRFFCLFFFCFVKNPTQDCLYYEIWWDHSTRQQDLTNSCRKTLQSPDLCTRFTAYVK